MVVPFPYNFKMLNITSYDDKSYPDAHVEVFHSWIDFKRVLKLASCQAFSLTLLKLVQSWHNTLPIRSIFSFE